MQNESQKEQYKPETNKPKTNKSETDKPETNKPKTNKSETDKPETNKPKTNKPETNKPETVLMNIEIDSELYNQMKDILMKFGKSVEEVLVIFCKISAKNKDIILRKYNEGVSLDDIIGEISDYIFKSFGLDPDDKDSIESRLNKLTIQ